MLVYPGVGLEHFCNKLCWCGSELVTAVFSTGVSCRFPGHILNGHIEGLGYSYGDTVTYTCNPGFLLKGDSNRSCQADGKWSGDQPSCDGKYLPVLY